jgi:uncharacterized protein (DUF1697 family)
VRTHVALLRGINNLGSKQIAMAELQAVVRSLGHTDVMTYIQSGNVLFTPRSASNRPAASAAALAAELERAIADGVGVRARAAVLSGEELACSWRGNPYPGETNPRLLHAVFLPETPGPGLADWVADAERQVRAKGSRDEAQVLGRTVYLHTPDGYPLSELRRRFARVGGPTSVAVAGTARNWATVSKLVELSSGSFPPVLPVICGPESVRGPPLSMINSSYQRFGAPKTVDKGRDHGRNR